MGTAMGIRVLRTFVAAWQQAAGTGDYTEVEALLDEPCHFEVAPRNAGAIAGMHYGAANVVFLLGRIAAAPGFTLSDPTIDKGSASKAVAFVKVTATAGTSVLRISIDLVAGFIGYACITVDNPEMAQAAYATQSA